MRWYTYLLIDQGVPFYVGKGARSRIHEHASEARCGHVCPKCNKIRKLWREGRDYTRLIIFRTDCEQDAFALEISLIAAYRARGVRLCNISDGGEGVVLPPDVLVRRAHSIKVWANTPAVRRLRKARTKASWANPEQRAHRVEKLRESLAKPEERAQRKARTKASWANPEYRALQSEKQRAAHNTPESLAKQSAASKAVWSNPEYRERMRAIRKEVWARRKARPATENGEG